MTSSRTPLLRNLLGGTLAVAAGAVLLYGVAGLLATPACGEAGQHPCSDDTLLYALALAVGVPLAVLAAFIGAGFFSFTTICVAVGAGSLIAAPASGLGAFPTVFGAGFFVLGLLPLAVRLVVDPRNRARRAAMADLRSTGLHGSGLVTAVSDTGVTVNDDPVISITVQVHPQDGGLPFERTTRALVPRVRIPRVGDACTVRYRTGDASEVLLDFSHVPAP